TMGRKKKEAKEKPLEKMTAKELRDLAMEIPEITGVHGMNKVELVKEIKKSRGIVDNAGSKKGSSVRDIKKKIRKVKALREKALKNDDKKMAVIYRRRISRLKKKTRNAA
ncbi:transcription termination factor Rho, partial [Desulfobacterales bacterium HSG16]|nr:transcription termination factor Rho [Desulfobacterales bacterium HSG16]